MKEKPKEHIKGCIQANETPCDCWCHEEKPKDWEWLMEKFEELFPKDQEAIDGIRRSKSNRSAALVLLGFFQIVLNAERKKLEQETFGKEWWQKKAEAIRQDERKRIIESLVRNKLEVFAHDVIKYVAVQTHTNWPKHLEPVIKKHLALIRNEIKE